MDPPPPPPSLDSRSRKPYFRDDETSALEKFELRSCPDTSQDGTKTALFRILVREVPDRSFLSSLASRGRRPGICSEKHAAISPLR